MWRDDADDAVPFTTRVIDAVILDMDGLMLDTERIARLAWQQAVADVGFVLDDTRFLELVGRRDDDCEQMMLGWFGAGFPLTAFRRLCRTRWEQHSASGISVKPGLTDLLGWIEDRGVPCAVATSSGAASAALKLVHSGLNGRIACIVTGDQVTRAKPAPDIYLEAARRLGVEPSRSVAVEDSDAGIASAHAAGMLPIMVPDLKPPSLESRGKALSVFASLQEVREFLDRTMGLEC